MANTVEIIVQGTDRTNPAFKNAVDNTKRLGAEMKGLGALLTQTGNIAAHFGNAQLGGMIANVGAATVGFRQMTAELGKSKHSRK